MADRKDKIHGRMEKVGRKNGSRKPARKSARKPASKKKSSSGSKSRASTTARRVVRKSKPRVRPSVRATARKKTIKGRPMPRPPKRRKVGRAAAIAGTAAVAAKAVTPETEAQVRRINDQFDRLEEQAQLTSIYNAIGNIDSMLTDVPFEVEALRNRGYVHSGSLEDRLEAIDEQWDEVRPRVEAQLEKQVKRLDDELDKVEPKVDRMKATDKNSIRAAETAVNGLSTRVNGAESSLDNLYDGIEASVRAIRDDMQKMEKVLDLLDESPEIRLLEAEGPLLAVKTIWRRDGDEGPEGILFLTDQRLIFEQREEIVTKKRFGLFKSESEIIQKVLIEVQTYEIESLVDKEEGGFMGMGKDDIMEMTFASTAPLSRARFHLKGQDSADWAVMIKRVQTGEIDEDRSDEYVEELEAAEAITFPTQCPNCFAAVPKPDRGVTSITCEFCGAIINPIEQE